MTTGECGLKALTVAKKITKSITKMKIFDLKKQFKFFEKKDQQKDYEYTLVRIIYFRCKC